MNVKDVVLSYGTFKVGDGTQTQFSEDKWLGPITLKEKFPALFNIVRRKHDIVAQVCNSSHLNISFRRNLTRNNLRDWNKIVACLLEFNLQDGRDQLIWSLHSFGQYSVRLL